MFWKKQQRNPAPGAHLDEMRGLEGRLGEENAVVRDDAHQEPGQAGDAADEGGAVAGLEFLEARPVHQPRDDFAHVVGLAQVAREHAVDLFRVVGGLLRLRDVGGERFARAEIADQRPRDLEGLGVVLGQVVGHAGDARVHVAASQILRGHVLSRRGLDQRRPRQEDRARSLDDDGLVGHRGNVRAARRAGAHDRGDLRNAHGLTCAPGCRRSGRSALGPERPPPAAADTRLPNPRGRGTADDSAPRSPGPAGAS